MKKLFNENGPLPEFPRDEVRSAITKGIKQAEEQTQMTQTPIQMKRKSKRKLLLYLASTAAAFSIIVGSAAYVSPTFANTLSQLPIVGSVFSNYDFLGLKQASEQGLTSFIGEKQTINGISVTIDEVLYDESNISVGFTIDSEKELSIDYFGAGLSFTINGANPEVNYERYGTVGSHTGVARFRVKDQMPDSFEMGLILESKKGEKWEFTVPVKKVTDPHYVPVKRK
ncbi:DUF4179 domain-containing protein [Lysinibacillus fusiformis]|uniref:DUF4179 domain-containing protein n=1 Tax=Lysinibacillus fusiformis TaxID=28031 RepID=UPI00301812B9